MIKKIITTIEEKYVFNISQYFWHIFIVLSSLVLIGGILLLIWGIIPPGKDDVEKEEYPPVVQVSSDEVLTYLNKGNQKQDIKINKEKTEQVVKPVTYTDPDEKAYNLSIDSLKNLIPPEKYSWNSKGYWYYPYGERSYNYYKNTRWASQYRQWIVSETGINSKLESAYSTSKANSYKQKKLILDAYINLVARFNEEKRSYVLKIISNYNGNDPNQTADNIKALYGSIENFGTDNVDFLNTLVNFGSNNPQEGKAFILYTNKSLVKFISDYRLDVLKSMINSFYNYFNNKVNLQIEVTDLFLKDIQKYEPEQYSRALEVYYSLITNKNRQRARKIENIEQEYSLALANTNAKYEMAKVEKAELRIKGVYLGVGAITTIAVLALILVLLSIQRYVKKIDDSLKGKKV